MLPLVAALAVVTATFQPAEPTIGDPIRIEFGQRVQLDPSPAYEVIARSETGVVIRTFQPRPLPLSGKAGDVYFRNLTVPIKSVLTRNDDLQPAPLEPPHALPMPREPFIAIALAALAAIVTWVALAMLVRRKRKSLVTVPPLTSAEQFRATVLALRDDPQTPQRWSALADATRAYLAARSPRLGTELTTTQLLDALLVEHRPLVAEILRQGDLEKFAPWGARAADFASVAGRALAIPEWFEGRAEEAAA